MPGGVGSVQKRHPMLSFVFCFVLLAVSGLIFGALWRLSITPLNRRFVVNDTPTGWVQIAWLLLQVYVVFGWAALCVFIARLFIAKPHVVFWLGYDILAFFLCAAPVYDRTPGSTNTIAWFAVAAFVGFSILPSLMLPWRWFLHFVP
jgi:hypothetical protein